jgi:AcrR family transcriptional regulator
MRASSRASKATARKAPGPGRGRGARAPRRVVKVPEDRQAEILDAAQALFLEHGYEATSVQQIIDRVGISKGAFYHHFESKEALLDRLVSRMAAEGAAGARAAAEQAGGSALDRLAACYRQGWSYKKAHLAVGLETMRILYAPDNLHLRTRMVRATQAAVLPVMVEIIGQGMQEGVFDCTDARWTAELILQLGTLVNDFLAGALFTDQRPDRERVAHLQQKLALYGEAVERLLGAPRRTIQIVEPDAVPLIVAAAAARRRGRAT